MVLGAYTDLITVIATSAATLTGLLFAGMSVSGSHGKSHPPIVREFRAAASLLAFINLLIASVLIGTARGWELVGNWDTGVLPSTALLMGRPVDVPSDRQPMSSADVEQLP